MDAHELDHQRLAELQQSAMSALETMTSALESVRHELRELQQRVQALEDRADYGV